MNHQNEDKMQCSFVLKYIFFQICSTLEENYKNNSYLNGVKLILVLIENSSDSQLRNRLLAMMEAV